MNILVVNCGSSSLKYQLIDINKEKALLKGLVERIGIGSSQVKQKRFDGDVYKIEKDIKDHKEALEIVLNAVVDKTHGAIKSLNEIDAVGHRVVHGGEKYKHSVIVNEDVLNELEKVSKLAPLHNPSNVLGIKVCMELMKDTPMVVVFDTAFHQTMPEEAYMYSIPYEYYEKDSIRKYGFHGTSHKYVANKLSEVLGKDINELKIVSCHLGNGSSITAIKNGESIDTSMGFTPLDGLPMGTRCGSIDAAAITYLMKEKNLTPDEIDHILNKESGILAVSGLSSDFRDVEDAYLEGTNKRASLALKIFNYNIKSKVGAYAAVMGGIDAIIFTAGVGENSDIIREEALKGLEFLGIEIDKDKNKVRGKIAEISKESSKVKVYVIPTNEELMIAKETFSLVK